MTFLRVIRGICFFAILAALGCHSTPLKPPTVASLNADAEWLRAYKEARALQTEDPIKSCEAFKKLAKDLKFPAHDVAQLRAVESCPADQFANFDRSKLPPWLQDQAIDVMLNLASSRANKASELDLALEKSKQKLPQSEKVKWMNLAIQRADDLQATDRLAELKARLYKIAPRLTPEPEERQYLSVAGDWRMVRQFDKAREYYERVLKSSSYDLDDKISALKGIRLTYKNARQNEKHLTAAKRLKDYIAKAFKAKANRRSKSLLVASYDSQVYLARALWTQGQLADALKIFDSLEKKMKGKVSLAELYWLKGRLADEKQDFDKVSKYMEMALKERFSDSELRDKILWYCAWNERRRGNLARAGELLADIDKKTQIDFTRQRALYWLGKTYEESQHPDEAKEAFTRLMGLDPLGYYGLLAHRQLNLPIALQTPGDTNPPVAEPPQIPMDTAVADWLYLLDEKDALTAFLDLASRSYQKQRDQKDDGWVTIFKYYAKAGLYMKLYESLGGLTPDRRKKVFEHHPELLFPQPWLDDVRAASAQFGVDEELIYAISRQESAFDTHARSLADAFGLMQLLPEVAEQLSSKYKIPYTGMEDLYDPKTNINFGAAHLKELFERHNNQFILAVASYNASESVIQNWMKNRFHGDAVEFIEEIPYEETRSYVRLVMRNWIFYSLLKSKSPSIAFPDRVLSLTAAK
jgi:soluble lytic murein transglycosylase